MGKTVIIMRHGKAADGFEYTDDFERPLVERGKLEVKHAALQLRQNGYLPEVILASPACRTAGTARIVAETLDINTEAIQYRATLYMSRLSAYFDAINSMSESCIMIAGHNPFVGEISQAFSQYTLHAFPTSAIAVFEIEEFPCTPYSKAKMLWNELRK